MTSQSAFVLRGRNPDILTCIANLSNDEVFTPPELANQMLDTLAQAWAANNDGANIWADKTVTFLDPCTKSGVFLREITARLTEGLKDEITDLQKRVDHILTKQVFGIGITQITSLLARRSVYCSKFANGEHSIAESFTDEAGNIWFARTKHTWQDNKCKFCSAPKVILDRSEGVENYAYPFIHTDDIKTWIAEKFGGDMQFDVVIGNPPYQMSDGGGEGSSAVALYHHFVTQAKKLEPRLLVMVIPARWYSGGKGLDEFRDEMMDDPGIAELHDFPETDMVFPGVNIRGGICYFIRTEKTSGFTKVVNYRKSGPPSVLQRPLREAGLETFVRYNAGISILKKVLLRDEPRYESRVVSRDPFGIPANFLGFSVNKSARASVRLFRSRRGSSSDKQVYIAESQIRTNREFKDKIKVLVSKASPGGDEYPHSVFSRPFVAPRNSVCTETYLIVDFVKSAAEGENLVEYMQTRFFRFLVALIKNTQNISKTSFGFVPVLDLKRTWSDYELYERYSLTEDEVAFIESMIRPMEADDE
jgi:site-specific DNA-methyltransferase (adenine-specific)